MRLAALCRCGRCGGPRRWSFSAGARAGPPVARSARHASMLLALPARGSPWSIYMNLYMHGSHKPQEKTAVKKQSKLASLNWTRAAAGSSGRELQLLCCEM